MTEISLYNTRTRRKEAFEPLDPANVRMYVCGPTVYDRAHIGNARPVVVFDVLFRLLRHVYGADHVTYVRNITDIDDKIIARAAENGRPIEAITEETTRWYHEDMGALGVLPPTHEPRATGFIGPMVAMIETLVERGHAYAAEGHVLFSVSSYPDYGKLARRSLEDMRAGARVEVAPYKRDPMDFVLWKPSPPDLPGWESPWGRGRPGWHIECSAMADALLGTSFDIHGGGIDLAFPHHENELAQSMCAHPEASFANVWLHNEMLNVDSAKMSKSLGNFFTIKDIRDSGLKGYEIRLALLMTHYRDPLDWTERRVAEAQKRIARWRRVLDMGSDARGEDLNEFYTPLSIVHTLADDINTPKIVESIDKCARVVEDNTFPRELRSGAWQIFQTSLELLGFDQMEPASVGDVADEVEKAMRDAVRRRDLREKIDSILERRAKARLEHQYALADAIRDALDRAGVDVEDGKSGSTWKLRNVPSINYVNAQANNALSREDDIDFEFWESTRKAMLAGQLASRKIGRT
jgi:cysteinyl-tRNA synthetase